MTLLYTIVDNIDSFCFFLMGLSVLYLFVFALLSHLKRQDTYPKAEVLHRFVVLFPAYKEDKVIENAVNNFLQQDYPKERYDVIVISDHMQEETNRRLSRLPVTVLKVNFENSTKAKAMRYAIESLGDKSYDMVIILDADNTVEPSFLHEFNNAYYCGAQVIQAHRMAKNLNTDTAILDAVSEEINNSIFRKGHVRLGFSSALIGSGMAIDYRWFKKNVDKLSTTGEDKELEVLLLKENIFIEYLENVPVYDEKTQKDSTFYNQRRRWLSAQFYSLIRSIKDFPCALYRGNFDYADKLFQWMMLPRIILLGLCILFSVALLPISLIWSIKWWVLTFMLLAAISLSVPDYLVNEKFIKALWKLPKLFILVVFNLFRMKDANKNFIHTEHSLTSKNDKP